MGDDTGTDLGVDLAYLWDSGRYLLPGVADEIRDAAAAVPILTAGDFYRTGGLGISDTGPEADVNSYAAELRKILNATATNIDDTGAALVYVANHYHGVDSAASSKLHQDQKLLEERPSLR